MNRQKLGGAFALATVLFGLGCDAQPCKSAAPVATEWVTGITPIERELILPSEPFVEAELKARMKHMVNTAGAGRENAFRWADASPSGRSIALLYQDKASGDMVVEVRSPWWEESPQTLNLGPGGPGGVLGWLSEDELGVSPGPDGTKWRYFRLQQDEARRDVVTLVPADERPVVERPDSWHETIKGGLRVFFSGSSPSGARDSCEVHTSVAFRWSSLWWNPSLSRVVVAFSSEDYRENIIISRDCIPIRLGLNRQVLGWLSDDVIALAPRGEVYRVQGDRLERIPGMRIPNEIVSIELSPGQQFIIGGVPQFPATVAVERLYTNPLYWGECKRVRSVSRRTLMPEWCWLTLPP